MRVRSERLAAREQHLFVGGECRFDVVGVRDNRLAELGTVEHRQVRAVAGRCHQVRGITQKREQDIGVGEIGSFYVK